MPRTVASRRIGLSPHTLAMVGGLAVWEAAGRLLGFQASVLPTPSRIALEISQNLGAFVAHLLETTLAAAAGLVIGSTAALPASLLGASPAGRAAFLPIARMLDRMPLALLGPLATLWFGASLGTKILLTALVAFAPAAVAVAEGLGRLDPFWMDMVRSLGGSRRDEVLRVALPASLVDIGHGARRAATPAVVAASLAELAGGDDRGLGYVLLAATSTVDVPRLFAALGLLAGVAFLLHAVVSLFQHILSTRGFVAATGLR